MNNDLMMNLLHDSDCATHNMPASPRHAAKDRRIVARLDRHAELMAKFEAEGLSRNEASRQAVHALLAEETERDRT